MIYRLAYVSRSALEGDAVQVDASLAAILATSRRNNADAGVSGALLFSAGWFAQVLEGDWDGVQATFERIQCDPRHLDTVVLQAGPVAELEFADWAMAYTGKRDDARPLLTALSGPPSGIGRGADQILAIMREVVRRPERV